MKATILMLGLLAACGPAGMGGSYLVYVRDAQGTVLAAVGENGKRVWRTHDDAYGLRLAYDGTPVPREFLDQPLDEETGFYQFHYRTYDPATAQWLSPDPKLQKDPAACAKQPGMCNPYAYGGNRPGEWLDPDGLWIEFVHGTIYVTLAFVGIDRGAALRLARQEIAAWNKLGGIQIEATMNQFANERDVPKSYHVVDANFERGGPSTSDRARSRIDLNADAPGSLSTFPHELAHQLGARDGYRASRGPDGRHTAPLPGREGDVMGTPTGTGFGPEAQAQMRQSQLDGDSNQGVQQPGASEWPYMQEAPPNNCQPPPTYSPTQDDTP